MRLFVAELIQNIAVGIEIGFDHLDQLLHQLLLHRLKFLDFLAVLNAAVLIELPLRELSITQKS